ncbi:MAG: hypothetical protein IKW43_01700 [Bacteroidaceae bacterium]|nr:hypothetical protein [Bacteroidaceae bacterium]
MSPLMMAIPELKLCINACDPSVVSSGLNKCLTDSDIRSLDARISANLSAFCWLIISKVNLDFWFSLVMVICR